MYLACTQCSGTWCCLCNLPLWGEPGKQQGNCLERRFLFVGWREDVSLLILLEAHLSPRALRNTWWVCLIFAQRGNISVREPTWGETASAPLGNDLDFPSHGCASGIIQVTQRRPGLLCTIERLSLEIQQQDIWLKVFTLVFLYLSYVVEVGLNYTW